MVKKVAVCFVPTVLISLLSRRQKERYRQSRLWTGRTNDSRLLVLLFTVLSFTVLFFTVGCQLSIPSASPDWEIRTARQGTEAKPEIAVETAALLADPVPTHSLQAAVPMEERVAVAPEPTLLDTFVATQIASIHHIAWSPDGKQMALTGQAEGGRTGLFVYSFPERALATWIEPSPGTYPTTPVYNPNGETLVAATGPNALTIWQAATGEIRQAVSQDGFSSIHSLAFAPDGSFLAIGGDSGGSGLIQLIEPATNQLIQSISTKAPMYHLSVHPDGEHLVATGQGTCQLGPFNALIIDRTNPYEQSFRREFSVTFPQYFSTGGREKVAGIRPFGPRCEWHIADVRIIDLATESIVGNVPRLAPDAKVMLSPDGSLLAVGDPERSELWRVDPFGLVMTFDQAYGTPQSFSLDGTQLALVQGNQVTLMGLPPRLLPAMSESQEGWQLIDDFSTYTPEEIQATYQAEANFPSSLATLTITDPTSPVIFTYNLAASDRDQSIFVTRRFEMPQDWSNAKFIEVEVRGGLSQAPLIVQLGEMGTGDVPLESWKGSRFVSANGHQKINLLLESRKDFNPEFKGNIDNQLLDLNNIGYLSIGTTAHHPISGTIEIVAIRLFE
ncbi:MAG: WD40 repeat domain-containing protein [Chloroflexota bacterium]